ncbi:ATP-binding protein, partial [Candidatus Pacearchaeota archaeon]
MQESLVWVDKNVQLCQYKIVINVRQLRRARREARVLPRGKRVAREDYWQWLQEAEKSRLIKTIVGFRRVGKSFLLKMWLRELEKKYGRENVLYLNFESDWLREVKTVQELRQVWEMYVKEIAKAGEKVVIWDEVQVVKEWEKLVRQLYEMGGVRIWLSGSNSSLLSGELASALAGRNLSLLVQPFSFREFLEYKGIRVDYEENEEAVERALRVYLRRGGLGEQLDLSQELAKNYRDNLLQKVIIDDIAQRFKVRNVRVLKDIFEFVAGNVSSVVSLRRIAGQLENQGIKVSIETVDNYLHYWQEAFALARVDKLDYKLGRVFRRVGKYYVVDNLFIRGGEENDEKRLENLVYWELRRRWGGEKVFYGKKEGRYEVDFIVMKNGEKEYIQVCWRLHEGNVKRELGNLDLAEKYGGGRGKLLTPTTRWGISQRRRNSLTPKPRAVPMIPSTRASMTIILPRVIRSIS